jgi:hypothetical protein
MLSYTDMLLTISTPSTQMDTFLTSSGSNPTSPGGHGSASHTSHPVWTLTLAWFHLMVLVLNYSEKEEKKNMDEHLKTFFKKKYQLNYISTYMQS